MTVNQRAFIDRRSLWGIALIAAVAVSLMLAMGSAYPAHAQSGRIAIIFATGGLGDQSFNDSAFEGIKRAEEELGIAFEYAEPAAVAEYETFLTRFAQTRRYDLIISIGFDQADAVDTVAQRFPNQKFAIVDTEVHQPNVAAFVYKEEERGFLLGAIAAMMTQKSDDPLINSDKKMIGVIGGMDIPLINANVAGYIAGAKYVDPEVDVRYAYVGDFGDPARGKELALAQIEQGVDVIWGAAGLSGLGVIQAAEEHDVYVIGADSDQGHLAPNHVLTNGMKLVNNTVLIAVEQVLSDGFQGGIQVLGVADGTLGFSKNLLPEDVIAEARRLEGLIASGQLSPPTTIDAVDAWLADNR